jgi:hypothetical protein
MIETKEWLVGKVVWQELLTLDRANQQLEEI